MARELRQIKIESILGGHSPTTHFAAEDQFRSSLGIDPALPIDDNYEVDGSGNSSGMLASGLLRPVSCKNVGSTTAFADVPLWITTDPKKNFQYYIYDRAGSVYSVAGFDGALTGLGDLNDGGNSYGNGAAYYDNYIYFSRSTTVARYGPLNGTPSFTDDYWAGSLGKTPLTDNDIGFFDYPYEVFETEPYSNHLLHRHSDGRLYILDTVDNKGTIHYIQTTKTTVEGDTDDGSTYNAVQVGYGLRPTAIESYGSDLVIAFVEGNDLGTTERAKIAFWDTTSSKVNRITWVEYPDGIVTALKNVNGVLYAFSGTALGGGFRITQYVGGQTFKDVYFSENGSPPRQGAVDGDGNRLLFGSYSNTPEYRGSIYSLNLIKSGLSTGVFNVMATSSSGAIITCLKFGRDANQNSKLSFLGGLMAGYSVGGQGALDRTDFLSYQYAPSVWWSQTYRVGQPFKITKIRIPLAQVVAANMTVTPKIYTDDGDGTSYTLTAIDNTNFSGKRNIVLRPENLVGEHNFWLELRWTGSALCTVGLPITIEYELIDD